MNTEQQQQRIMGYFIEEAKDHLNTIEQSVLNLQDVLLDSEMTNEMFRAAHSIKGGAAMLGVVSVQHISHRLEDYFKILQEHKNIQVDEKLKSLFLAGFDRLQELVEQLESNSKISDEVAEQALQSVKPVFLELQSHLNNLVDGAAPNELLLVSEFQAEVASKLRDMLQLFKHEESPLSRRELEDICTDLFTIGKRHNYSNWCELVMAAKSAIAHEENSYRTLAPIIIKDTKNAEDLVVSGRDIDIVVSSELLALIPTTASLTSFNDDEDLDIFMQGLSDFDLGSGDASSDISMDELFAEAGIDYDSSDNLDFDNLSGLFEGESELMSAESHDFLDNSLSNETDFNDDLENLFAQSAESEGLGFEDFNDIDDLENLFETPPEKAVAATESKVAEPEGLELDDFFLSSDNNDEELDSLNAEALEFIEAGSWNDEISGSEISDEFFDELINDFSAEITDEPENISELAPESMDISMGDESIADLSNEADFDDLYIDVNDSNEFPEFDIIGNGDILESVGAIENDNIIENTYNFSDSESLPETFDVPADDSFSLENFSLENLENIETDAKFDDSVIEFSEEDNAEDKTSDEAQFLEESYQNIAEDNARDEQNQIEQNDSEWHDELSAANISDTNLDDINLDGTNIDIAAESSPALSFEAPSIIGFDNFSESPSSIPKTESDDFDDLEELLRDSGEIVGAGATTRMTKRPAPAKRQASKIVSQTMKVEVKHLDSLNNLVGELVVNRNLLDQDQEKMQQFLAKLLNQVQMLSDVSQKMRDQYDRSLLENSLVATRAQNRVSTALMTQNEDEQRSQNTSSGFDSIELDRFSDFHTLSQEIIELIVRVRESASDIEFVVDETEQVTRQLGVITNQVQDDLKQSRMVPFAQIADRLPRAVRDLAIKTGREADIEIKGRETLIDKAILEQLYDPMTHLISNAIVHGLEEPHTRLESGKQSKGMITVRAYHQGNQTIISVGDDGTGIDVTKVKQSAVNKGVRTQEEVDRLSDEEVFELLFEPGFSTKLQADEFCGRGVGLDVVSTALNDIRGTVFTESAIGVGTTFTIRLPLTLSISKAMLCVSNRTRIAFPVDGFEDMVEAPQNQIFTNEQGQSCLTWRNTTLPFQPLANLLNYTRHVSRNSIYSKLEDDVISIVVLRNDSGYLALQVDQFLGEAEIVIKQLEGPIPKPVGIAGATILGDGHVMAIANVLELFDIAGGRLKPASFGAPEVPLPEQDETADPIVLIVDDSITVRELLSLTFSKVGYRVEQAKDGKDAWEKLRAGMQCNLIFCDIEMPRMDGLEFLSRVQKDEVLSKIPIAMLTSRGADRHRNAAKELGAKGYFTKPYLEEEVITASRRLLRGEVLV